VAGRRDRRVHRAAGGGVLRVAARGPDVDACVPPAVAGDGVDPVAVGRGDVQRVGHRRGDARGGTAAAHAIRPTAPAAGAARAAVLARRLLAGPLLTLAPLTLLPLALGDALRTVRLDTGDDPREAVVVGLLLGEVGVELLAQALEPLGELGLLPLDLDDLAPVGVRGAAGVVGGRDGLLGLHVELVDAVAHRRLAQLAVAVDGGDRLEVGDDLGLGAHRGVD